MRAKRAETEAKRAETEWNIEKERLELLSDSSDGNAAGFDSIAGKEVRHLQPRMSDNSDDCLSCFHSLTLTLNNVAKTVWPKLLLPLLSASAQNAIRILRLNNAWILKR